MSGALRWHVRDEGDGPCVLLLHGAGASAESFAALTPLLTPRFRVVAVDLPGHARTRVPPHFVPDLPTIAAALGELLDELGLEPERVVGHSAGAAVAARMVLDGMIRPARLIGLAAALLPFEGAARVLFPSAARLLHGAPRVQRWLADASPEHAAERLLASTGSRVGPASVDTYRRLARQPEHLAGVVAMLAHWNLEALRRELPRLETPVRLLAGEADLAVPLAQQRALAALLPRAELVVIPGAGHLLHEEMPHRVAHEVWADE